jgi:peptide/nickel transport system permease protein
MACVALAIALGLGVAIGAVAAFFGGRLETYLMRLVELQVAFPFIVLALVLLTVFRISIPLLIVVLVLSSWGAYARTFRGAVLAEKNRAYVLAARAIGASPLRVLVNHILRSILPTVLVFATIDLTYLVTLEAALSFVGLGVQPPTPSWGNIMGDGKDYLDTAWWISTIPGGFLALFSVGFNLMGDSLEDLIAPELRR